MGTPRIKSNLFNLTPPAKLWIGNFKKLGKAEVKFLMLMLTQAQLNLTCPFYIIRLDTHFVMELKIGSIYLYKDDEFVFLLQIHILHAFD